MSTLYISTTGSAPSSAGVWRVSSSDYQYVYSAFTAGEDVNLDQVSVSTNPYDAGQSAPSNFQVGIYTAGVNSLTPGSLISYLRAGLAYRRDLQQLYANDINNLKLRNSILAWLHDRI